MVSTTTDNGKATHLPEDSIRALRLFSRAGLKSITQTARVRSCGNPFAHGVAVRSAGSAAIRSAGFSGVSTCGSVWLCPVCSFKIAVQRAESLAPGIGRWVSSADQHVEFVTLTARHTPKDSLEDVWEAVRAGWNSLTSGAGWKADRAAGDIQGYHRTTEVTWSERSGWHVHFHVLLFMGAPITSSMRDHLRGRFFSRWQAGLAKQGFTARYSVNRGGKIEYPAVDFRPMKREKHENLEISKDLAQVVGDTGLAEYVQKTGLSADAQLADGRKLAMEVLGGASKTGRTYGGVKSMTPFTLLGTLTYLLEEHKTTPGGLKGTKKAQLQRLFALWFEWEQFSQGKRQMTMSQNLKDLLDLGEEETDEELAAKEVAYGRVLAIIPSKTHQGLVTRRTGVLAQIEQIGHEEGREGLMRLSDQYDLGMKFDVFSIARWDLENAHHYSKVAAQFEIARLKKAGNSSLGAEMKAGMDEADLRKALWALDDLERQLRDEQCSGCVTPQTYAKVEALAQTVELDLSEPGAIQWS